MYKINPADFDKTKLVNSILDNYKLSKNRNEWDNKSNIHHENSDIDNPNFKKLDYTMLVPIYDKLVKQYLNEFKWKGNVTSTYEISNYTCMGRGQFMKSHEHGSDFTGVHYIKFNKEHKSTKFYNPNSSIKYFDKIVPNLVNNLDRNDIYNSWAFESWCFDIEEDYICFAPSKLTHSVPQQQTDHLRITVILNIHITPPEEKENG
tara:strand:- start:94 stop:708 length:615 start_codon:yes stop_codon:yes gene_type:complete